MVSQYADARVEGATPEEETPTDQGQWAGDTEDTGVTEETASPEATLADLVQELVPLIAEQVISALRPALDANYRGTAALQDKVLNALNSLPQGQNGSEDLEIVREWITANMTDEDLKALQDRIFLRKARAERSGIVAAPRVEPARPTPNQPDPEAIAAFNQERWTEELQPDLIERATIRGITMEEINAPNFPQRLAAAGAPEPLDSRVIWTPRMLRAYRDGMNKAIDALVQQKREARPRPEVPNPGAGGSGRLNWATAQKTKRTLTSAEIAEIRKQY